MEESTITKINGKNVRLLKGQKINPKYTTNKQQIFIVGSKGIPAVYGGFETFVEKLTEYRVSDRIRYHVSSMCESKIRYEYNNAKCFGIKVPNIGSAKAIYYDIIALKSCIEYCKSRPAIKQPIFYILACRIGPFIGFFKRKIEALGGVLYVNPDGHEWKRAKWSAPIRSYWKISEKFMIKYADLIICDSKSIQTYIQQEYKPYRPKTTFIAYGSETTPSVLADDDFTYNQWLEKKEISPKNYYLVVGRFVPENNFETMIHEFMKSKSERDFVIITTANDIFLRDLENRLHFKNDKRIKFVGTVYNQELLKKIRENAYGYLHGHEVGGTNPSLLEALGGTELNLLLNVDFNREVAENAALYWTKETGDLAKLIDYADKMTTAEINRLGVMAKKRITEEYSWNYIINEYEQLFLKMLQ